jgi:hypothetical protein
MRVAGRLAAQAVVLAGEHCMPGVTTDEVDRVVHEFLCDHGAYPSTLGYKGVGGGENLCEPLADHIVTTATLPVISKQGAMPGDFPAVGPRHCCTTLTRKPRRRLTRPAGSAPLTRSSVL